jgi:hypothetical protein
MAAAHLPRAMPEPARSSHGQGAGPDLDRHGPKRADALDIAIKHDADKITAAWFDHALTFWGKATAFAELIGVDLAHVSRWRTGEKPIPLRAVLPFMHNVEAVLALVGPLLESIGYVARPVAGPTFAQLAGAVLADLDDGSAVTRQLIENAAKKRGWSHEQVEIALHKENEK